MTKNPDITFNKFASQIKNLLRKQSLLPKKELHDVLTDQLYNIDETTSSDLMLNNFEDRYNNTCTECGSQLFHHYLYSIKNKEDVLKLQEDMQEIKKYDCATIKKYLKKKTGKLNGENIVTDLWDGSNVQSIIIKLFYTIFIINLSLTVLLSIYFTKYTAVFVCIFFLVNFICYLFTNGKINTISSSIGYFIRISNTVNFIHKKYNIKLSVPCPQCKDFNRLWRYTLFFKSGIGGPQSGDMISVILDYLRVFFGMEIFAFKSTEKIIRQNKDEVQKYILYLGYVDFILNSLNIISEDNCCYSTFNENDEIAFTFMTHPLVDHANGQDKIIASNLIVTGMNMSGKTTFMKSLGLNQILATSFGFCFAREFSTQIKDVLSSICINDRLLEGRSRYYAEAERLMKLKQTLSNHSCLCLIDEILSGTNSEERIQGSVLILNKFAQSSSRIIAATHDTEIAEKLSNSYTPVYFDGNVNGNRIDFDYKIKDGIVSRKNGLLLLQYMGF